MTALLVNTALECSRILAETLNEVTLTRDNHFCKQNFDFFVIKYSRVLTIALASSLPRNEINLHCP